MEGIAIFVVERRRRCIGGQTIERGRSKCPQPIGCPSRKFVTSFSPNFCMSAGNKHSFEKRSILTTTAEGHPILRGGFPSQQHGMVGNEIDGMHCRGGGLTLLGERVKSRAHGMPEERRLRDGHGDRGFLDSACTGERNRGGGGFSEVNLSVRRLRPKQSLGAWKVIFSGALEPNTR